MYGPSPLHISSNPEGLILRSPARDISVMSGQNPVPRYLPTLAAVLLCAAAVRMAITAGRPLFRPPDAMFVAPGKFAFVAPQSDEFTLWQFSTAAIDGEFRIQKVGLPVETSIRITRADGAPVPILVDRNTTITTSQGERRSVLRFEVSQPEKYWVEVSGLPVKRKFEVTHGPVFKPLLAMIGWASVSVALGLASIVFAVVAATGLFPKRPKRSSVPAPASGVTHL